VKRRIIAASVAIVVALVSGVLLLDYVTSADQRAMAGMRTQKVLVVTTQVPKGTAADHLGKLVELRELPASAIVPGALTSTSDLNNEVTTTTLEPGEQVLASRFARPAEQHGAAGIQVPKGYSEVSVQLDPDRAVGSNLTAGDRVGVFLSLGDGVDKGRTHLVLDKVLITRVQGATAGQSSDQQSENSSADQQAPQGSLMITMAVSANDAEQVVFAAEYGQIWLELQNTASTAAGTRIVTEKSDQQ